MPGFLGTDDVWFEKRRLALNSRNRFVLQNAHYDTTIFGSPLYSRFIAHLLAFAHRTRCDHSGERHFTLLKQNLVTFWGPIFTFTPIG